MTLNVSREDLENVLAQLEEILHDREFQPHEQSLYDKLKKRQREIIEENKSN